MFHSVRWRLIFNSVIISLTAIVAVGVITLVLLEGYFTQQERDYLQEQSVKIAPALELALSTRDGENLQETVAILGFLSDVRIQILDAQSRLLFDSGERGSYQLGDDVSGDRWFGLLVDHRGHVVGFRPSSGGKPVPFYVPPMELGDNSQITAISDTSKRLPLYRGNEKVGYVHLSEGPAVGEGVRRSVRTALLSGSAAALVVAILVGGLSARQVTRPLKSLGQAVEQMSAGELTARAPASDLTEFERLARQFNQMAEQLAGTIRRLRQERHALRQMIADASHEIRTPLTALKTFNALMRDEALDGETVHTFIDESGRQIEQLEHLTTNLLDLSRLEARLRGTDFADVDLRKTVSDAVEGIRLLADERRQMLEVALPEEPIVQQHDPAALGQAVRNLVHNAIKYTPAGGAIHVAVHNGDVSQIVVEDNGDGIAAESLPQIFNRFYRAPEAQGEGSGLGLAIAREIVDIHGGDIAVETQPGVGSTFTITLPPNGRPAERAE